MSFIIANTGRAASRAFSINLGSQPDLVTIPRYRLDAVMSKFIAKGKDTHLHTLADEVSGLRRAVNGDLQLGLVLHAVRPQMAQPFTHPRNIEFLSALRDRLGVKTAFLPVREPEALALSELNRRLAALHGDWSFKPGEMHWKSAYTPEDMQNLAGQEIPDPEKRAMAEPVNMNEMVTDIAQRTGSMLSIYNLFRAAFDEVHIIPYEKFLSHPNETMRRIADIADVPIVDSPLAHVKLNSLSNRLLIYNPIVLQLPFRDAKLDHNWYARLKRGGFGPNATAVRFRFEIKSVIPLCRDWGSYLPLDVDCSPSLSKIEEDVGASIDLGINLSDLNVLDPEIAGFVTSRQFVRKFVAVFGSIFAKNYEATKKRYKKNIYLNKLPDDVRHTFFEINRAEIDGLNELLQSGDARSIFDDTVNKNGFGGR